MLIIVIDCYEIGMDEYKKKIGSALMDYIVPTAVVGLVLGLGLWGFRGSGTLKNYLAGSGNMNIEDDTAIIGSNVKGTGKIIPGNTNSDSCTTADCLGGTTNKPVQVCNNGTCIIDFGEFILQNIPEDFAEKVESSSVTGTEDLLALVEQMVNQIDDPNTPEDEASEMRVLANVGHYIANVEKVIEAGVTSCKSQTFSTTQAKKDCMSNYVDKNMNLDTPDNLTGILADNVSNSLGDRTFIGIRDYLLGFGKARAECDNKSGCTVSTLPAQVAYTKLIEIQKSPDKYSDTQKSIATMLYNTIEVLGHNLKEEYLYNSKYIQGEGNTITVYDYTPAGDSYSLEIPNNKDFEYKDTPNTGFKTDIKSALICATGHKYDDLSACY